jgi:hypothetical protein
METLTKEYVYFKQLISLLKIIFIKTINLINFITAVCLSSALFLHHLPSLEEIALVQI